MVLVQFRVKVRDVERFRAASHKHAPTIAELGGRNHRRTCPDCEAVGQR